MIIIILNLTAILAAPVKIPMDIALPSPVAALAENRAVSFPNSIPANSYGGHILESIAGKNQLIHGAGLETGVPHNLANGRPPISPTAPFFKSNSRPPASFISGQVDGPFIHALSENQLTSHKEGLMLPGTETVPLSKNLKQDFENRRQYTEVIKGALHGKQQLSLSDSEFDFVALEAKRGDPEAHDLLANYFAQSPDSAPHLVNKHIRAAANKGHAPSQILVGMENDHSPKDAKLYYEKAAQQGEPNALTMLASAEERLGANPAKSMRLYRDAMRKERHPYAIMRFNAIKEERHRLATGAK